MQRYLSIVLGDNCNISKTLISDNSYELDKYIFDNFKDSEQIRQKYKLQIDKFLNENKTHIHNVEATTGKMYRGQIVILQCNEDSTLKRIKVIYKKDVDKVKKELLADQEFMQKFIHDNRKYFSPFIYNKTRRLQKPTVYANQMREFYKNIKGDASFFEFCRCILKYAENYYVETQNKIVNNDLETPNNTESQIDLITDDPDCSYIDSFDPDWNFHPDLDDIARGIYSEDGEPIDNTIETDDEEEYEDDKSKVKIYKIDFN